MKYLHLFDTETNFNTVYKGKGYVEPWASYTEDVARVSFNKEKWPFGLLETPLTFEITGNGDIVWKANKSDTALIKTIEYKLNDGEWVSITSNTGSSAPRITVVSGDIVQFRGNNTQISIGNGEWVMFNGTTAQFNIKGNIMSLLNKTNYSTMTRLSKYTFKCLFYNCTGLTDASKLLLPATTLADSCYASMFYGCSSLTAAPELPATILAKDCYEQLFHTCSGLNYIKCLATDISATGCTNAWLYNVASSGTIVTPSSVSWRTGDSGIPTGWTRVDA